MSATEDRVATWTAAGLQQALWRHFAGRYAVLVEVPARDPEADARYQAATEARQAYWEASRAGATGLTRPDYVLGPGHRRIDVLLWSPGDLIALELKVARSDYLADVRDPDKQRVWRELAHRHAYVVPHGLVGKADPDLPADSGLLVVTGAPPFGGCSWAKRAPMRRNVPAELPPRTVSTLMHRLAWAEAHAKGLHTSAAEEHDAGALRAERDRLRRRLEVVGAREQRLQDRAEHYRKLASRDPGWPCQACGEALTARWSSRLGETWRHKAGAAADTACDAARAADLAARKAAGERFAYDRGARPAPLVDESEEAAP